MQLQMKSKDFDVDSRTRMFVRDNSWRVIPALQKIATVPIVGALLRAPEYREIIQNASWANRSLDTRMYVRRPELKHMIEKIATSLDRLPLPKVLKDELKTYLASMVNTATRWLVCVAENTPSCLKKQYWRETIYQLIRHLQWDSLGCVDGRMTLESYVSNRDTIDFIIWNQLCFYCMEHEIIRFSKTIDWRKCKKCFGAAIPIYWYQKVYGQFPTKRMYSWGMYQMLDKYECYELMIDEEEILRMLFDHNCGNVLRSRKTAPALEYFQNYLRDDREFDELTRCTHFPAQTDEVNHYLLRTMGADICIAGDGSSFGVIRCLAQLPFILFIDDWIGLFETMNEQRFGCFFMALGRVDDNITNDRQKTLYEPFEKMWRVYYKRFSSNLGSIITAFFFFAGKNDITLLKIVFKDLEDHQRMLLIEGVQEQKWKTPNRELAAEFSEKVLKNDKEKKLFFEDPCRIN